MQKLKINLNSTSSVQEFVKMANSIDCYIDVAKDHYVVDGKSLVGLLTIDLSNPVDLIIHSDDKEITNKFERWKI